MDRPSAPPSDDAQQQGANNGGPWQLQRQQRQRLQLQVQRQEIRQRQRELLREEEEAGAAAALGGVGVGVERQQGGGVGAAGSHQLRNQRQPHQNEATADSSSSSTSAAMAAAATAVINRQDQQRQQRHQQRRQQQDQQGQGQEGRSSDDDGRLPRNPLLGEGGDMDRHHQHAHQQQQQQLQQDSQLHSASASSGRIGGGGGGGGDGDFGRQRRGPQEGGGGAGAVAAVTPGPSPAAGRSSPSSPPPPPPSSGGGGGGGSVFVGARSGGSFAPAAPTADGGGGVLGGLGAAPLAVPASAGVGVGVGGIAVGLAGGGAAPAPAAAAAPFRMKLASAAGAAAGKKRKRARKRKLANLSLSSSSSSSSGSDRESCSSSEDSEGEEGGGGGGTGTAEDIVSRRQQRRQQRRGSASSGGSAGARSTSPSLLSQTGGGGSVASSPSSSSSASTATTAATGSSAGGGLAASGGEDNQFRHRQLVIVAGTGGGGAGGTPMLAGGDGLMAAQRGGGGGGGGAGTEAGLAAVGGGGGVGGHHRLPGGGGPAQLSPMDGKPAAGVAGRQQQQTINAKAAAAGAGGNSKPGADAGVGSNAAAAAAGDPSSGASPAPSPPASALQQPDGWRVKLYRLNADGSWDDCGTGRIVCLYRPPPPPPSQQQQQQQQHANSNGDQKPGSRSNQQGDSQGGPGVASPSSSAPDSNSSNKQQQHRSSSPSSSASANNTNSSSTSSSSSSTSSGGGSGGGDQWLYQETGEATLCVQAEVTKQNRQPRVLLRTRILLRDAYQRQGDNIITWCEPYYNPQQQQQQSLGNGNIKRGNSNDAVGLDEVGDDTSGSNGNNSNNGNGNGVDLALSFQDNAGCLDIWRQITHVQGRAAELIRRQQQHQHQQDPSGKDEGSSGSSVEDMAAQVAAQHHADLQRQQQQQQDLWSPNSSTSSSQQQHSLQHSADDHHHMLMRSSCGSSGSDGGSDIYGTNSLFDSSQSQFSLPNPPTLANLEDIADTIAALQHVQQRESLAMWIAKDECAYLKSLLALFPSAEVRGDYGKLATLAACVKTILLLNDPSILELIVSVSSIFEEVCSCLEYDPDLREKANHRWFLRERAKFRTVVPMEDPDLVEAIHRSFRVSYLRDTLLRPTMDESSLSTLSSLQTFTYADVVKGVTMAGNEPDGNLFDSYLIKVIDMLCVELHALSIAEWAELETLPIAATTTVEQQQRLLHHLHNSHVHDAHLQATDPSIVVGKHSIGIATWKQYLAPQDGSLSSRRMRRRGCLSFLKELFNMVRLSLQQNDKDDFFSVICSLAIDLNEVGREIADNVSQTSQTVEVGSVASTVKSDRLDEKSELPHPIFDTTAPPPPTNLLSMLGSVLADPNTDVSEKGAVLEIIAGVVMHDPGLIRRHCLNYHADRKNRLAQVKQAGGGGREVSFRPEPNEKNQVVFWCPANDLLASLLFLLDVETDAGVLLQVSEIMRIILDTDMVSDHGPMAAGFADEAEEVISPGGGSVDGQMQSHEKPSGSTGDQKQFLTLFYEQYVEWLVAPFQFTTLHPIRRVPDYLLLDTSDSPLLQRMMMSFQKGAIGSDDALLKTVPACAVRCSFAVELLSFCVRAHLYRMKFFLLKSRVLGSVLKLLRRQPHGRGISGDRCLKLAALRFLRAILSVNDEFYHRHIIQHDLFDPVFEALRSNPVGDNLVSSAIVEMCDYIHSENVKSLIEYIVTRHLSANSQQHPENTVPSLEDVSSPYVSTLTVLRKAYEANLNANATRKTQAQSSEGEVGVNNKDRECSTSPGSGGISHNYQHHSSAARQLTGKALEDQRKFREVDQEESYFDSDDDHHHHHHVAPKTALPTATGSSATNDSPISLNSNSNSNPGSGAGPSGAVDEVDRADQQIMSVESELHRTPRMFSLTQAPLFSNLGEENSAPLIANSGGDGNSRSTSNNNSSNNSGSVDGSSSASAPMDIDRRVN